jgi:hypothetical protein
LRVGALALLLTLTACGGGDNGGDTPPSLGTLAYVETECHDTKEGFVEHQALRIRQGEREPVTVFETPGVGPITGIGGACRLLTQGRGGTGSIAREAFQAVTVSPDGASVVFDVTDEFSVRPPLPLHLPPEQKGLFWVRADGTGLRPLGPPSQVRFFFLYGFGVLHSSFPLSFSPDGRTIAFADKGPDAGGHEADQVVTVDVATLARTQVTGLPPAVPPPSFPSDSPTIFDTVFVDDRTISFHTTAKPGGLNPEGTFLQMTIKTDSSHRLEVPLPIPIALPGGQIELRFVITGDRPQATSVLVPGTPSTPVPGFPPEIWEIFAIDQGKNILQLTNFRRSDTRGGLVDVDREHVYFHASADPLGTNPSENCQLFSIDRTGANLRQLTNFRESEHSSVGCYVNKRPNGCAVLETRQDPLSRTLVFYSNCDPLGTNPNGTQIFAIQPDGSGLRQLTDSRGLVKEADGTYSGELPGPWAYGPYAP